MSEYLTISQASERIKASRTLLQVRCREGVLPAIKVGKTYRIKVEDLEEWAKHTPSQFKGKQPPASEELTTLMDEWASLMATKGNSIDTIRTYTTHLRGYIRRLNVHHLGFSSLDGLFQRSVLLKVLASIPEESFSSKMNTYRALLTFGRFLIESGRLPEQVVEAIADIKLKRVCEPKRPVLKAEDLQRLFDTILTRKCAPQDNLMLVAVCSCMCYAGLRNSEVCNLRLEDVDLQERVITVRRGKGGKLRKVGISSVLKSRLEDYLKVRPNGPRFFNPSDGTTLSRPSLGRRMIALSNKLGIHVTCHALRRAFATLADKQGRSINSIRIALGHTNLRTTQVYLRTSEAEVVEQMKDW